MRYLSLRVGSSGPLVRDIQIMLNDRLNPSPNIKANGYFSPQTERALRMFQDRLWLESDGTAAQSTFDGLFETEIHPPIMHNVPYISQLNPALRWAAATAMLTHSPVQYVRRLTPPALVAANGSMLVSLAQEQRLAQNVAFARAHQLTYHAPQSWPVASVVNLLKNGPLMAEFSPPVVDLRRGSPTWQHVVIVGARGSHEADGRTTTLRLHSPDDSRGRGIHSVLFSGFLRSAHLGSIGFFSR